MVSLFEAVRATGAQVSAPWWLRALAAGRLQSRMGGFAVEDQVSELLDRRAGWAYMPWAGAGEDGYWEYVPPEEDAADLPLMPTTVQFTDRHQGWLDVIVAHEGRLPEPMSIAGPTGLRAELELLEKR
ncbi:MAG TPA: hypothetical protein VHX38_32635 [Pseudonocardiaceae bacterium]|nr:hypothetical protein [Pseudonocardiaceae bacterium]